jgi:hypothetical protein
MSLARDKANSTVSNFASTGIDDNADANAITIDSSENVLVGTTNTDPAFNNVTGQSMAASGQFQVTRDGGTAALFNRKSSDGEIVSIRKDSTTVGSIGASGGRPYFSNGTESIRLAGGSFEPANATGSSSDNTYDLGVSGARWKNLYLSGGVYLGGTGSANYLEDYEEGTWTPSIGGNATYDVQSGVYTKIGRMVFVWLYVAINTKGTGSGNLISGLPFNPGTSNQHAGVAYYNAINQNTYEFHLNFRSDGTIRSELKTSFGTGQSSGGTWTTNGATCIASGWYYT